MEVHLGQEEVVSHQVTMNELFGSTFIFFSCKLFGGHTLAPKVVIGLSDHTYNLRLSWIKQTKYVSYVGDSLGMGIGAGNSTSRRGSRVAGKKDYTNFDFDPNILFVCLVF